jgi:hypothetical protein
LPVPRDTTVEIAELQHAAWLAASPRERIEWWNQRSDTAREMRRAMLRRQHPGLSGPEIQALWLEQTYRGQVPDSLLDAAIDHLRRST